MADIGLDELADAVLRVQLIARFQVYARASSTPVSLPAGKATTAAELLAVRRGSFVSVDAIIDVLWGEDAPPAAAQNVASLVRRLRRVLGPELITGGRAGYRFEGARCVVDVDVAERLAGEAEAQLRSGRPTLAASAAAQARAILERGGFLEDEAYAEWAEEGRRHAERLLQQARRAAWRAALAFGDNAAALEAATRAVETTPLDEEAHRARMHALSQAGDAGSALAAYERLRTTLVEELGADPSPQTEALHLAILRSEPLPREDRAVRAETAATANGPRRPSDQATELVGREQELETLAERWAKAAGGGSRCSSSREPPAPAKRPSAASSLVRRGRLVPPCSGRPATKPSARSSSSPCSRRCVRSWARSRRSGCGPPPASGAAPSPS